MNRIDGVLEMHGKVKRAQSFTSTMTDGKWDLLQTLKKTNNRNIKRSCSFQVPHWKEHKTLNLLCTDCSSELSDTTTLGGICTSCQKAICRRCMEDKSEGDSVYCSTCLCSAEQQVGVTRSLTADFTELHERKRVNIKRELHRLAEGFRGVVSYDSPVKNALNQTLFAVKVPEWQKSDRWQESDDVEWCMGCNSKFALFYLKGHCRLCGLVFCKSCTSSSLLVFYNESKDVHVKVLGVVGCPTKEPAVCLYLNICSSCHHDFAQYQLWLYHNATKHEETSSFSEILKNLRTIEEKLRPSLASFRRLVDTYLFNKECVQQKPVNTEAFFGTTYTDVGLLLTEYLNTTQQLNQQKPSSQTERKIFQKVYEVRCEQYNNAMGLFNGLRASIGDGLAKQLQTYATLQAISNAYARVHQLGMEALKLALKCEFKPCMAVELRSTDQVCVEEMKECVLLCQKDWSSHISSLNQLVKEQMILKPLVSPLHDNVERCLMDKSCVVIAEVLKSLREKTSTVQFAKTKTSLLQLIDFMTVWFSKS